MKNKQGFCKFPFSSTLITHGLPLQVTFFFLYYDFFTVCILLGTMIHKAASCWEGLALLNSPHGKIVYASTTRVCVTVDEPTHGYTLESHPKKSTTYTPAQTILRIRLCLSVCFVRGVHSCVPPDSSGLGAVRFHCQHHVSASARDV